MFFVLKQESVFYSLRNFTYIQNLYTGNGIKANRVYFPSIKDLNSFTLWSLATDIAWSRARTLARSFTICFMFSLKKEKKLSISYYLIQMPSKENLLLTLWPLLRFAINFFEHTFLKKTGKQAIAYKEIK